MKVRLLLILLGFIGILANVIAIPWLIVSILISPYGDRAWIIIKAYDTLANATTGGKLGETISARAYQESLKGNKYGCWLCKVLDWLQPNHCENTIK